MIKGSLILRALCLAAVLALGWSVMFAQVQTGEILGVVTDATGASVPGATVTLTNTGTGLSRQSKTDEQGRYDAADLDIGNYQVKADMQGFAPQVQNGLVLAVGQKLVTDFKLEVGTVAQEVTVSSSAASQINTSSSEMGGLVGEQQLQELPLNGRNATQLFFLVPGVQPTEVTNIGANYGLAPRFSVAGQRIDAGSTLLDGMEIRSFWGDAAGNQILGTSLGVESIAEVQTMTTTFNAQYNGASVLNQVTRSGTNSFHGSGYGFFRNSAMDARSFFNPITGPPDFHRNQFGVSLGGPIKKTKAFFFVNYEGLRASLSLQNTQFLPDANAHSGMLPCLEAADQPSCKGANPANLVSVPVNAAVAPYLALWPQCGPPQCSEVTQNATVGGVAYTNVPTGTTERIEFAPNPQTEDYLATKLDYQLSTKNSLAFHFVRDYGATIEPWPNGGAGSTISYDIDPYQETDPEPDWIATLQDRHIFSNNLINVGSVSFVRTNQAINCDFSKVPAILKSFVPTITAEGNISVSGIASVGACSYSVLQWIQNAYAAQDEVDWVHGAHTFKFGGGVARYQCNCIQITNPGASYSFSGMENFFEDNPSTLQGPVPTYLLPPPAGSLIGNQIAQRYSRQTNLSVFVQDDWKINRRLTLNIGIRDDYISNPTEATNQLYRIVNLDPLTCSNNPGCDGGVPEAGVSGATAETGTYGACCPSWTHEHTYFENNPSNRNIDPRVGLAWDIFGNHKTSFRAGFGIFHSLLYPRTYVEGGSYAYPQVQSNVTAFGGAEGTFPNAVLNASTNSYGRNQFPWYYCCTPYYEEWSATIERQLPWGMTGSIGYQGSQGIHLIANQDNNANVAEVMPDGNQYRPLITKYSASGNTCPIGGATPATVTPAYGYTPNCAFGYVNLLTPELNSHYHGLILNVTRYVGGVQFQSGFTYSRCIDWGSSSIAVADEANDASMWMSPHPPGRFNKGLCAFNISKNWSSSALIPLPLHGNQLKEGWLLAAIVHAQTGNPVTPSIAGGTFDISNWGNFSYTTERANINTSFTGPFYEKAVTYGATPSANVVQWFNPNAYAPPAQGYLGNAGRGSILGPGLFDMDLSIIKRTKLPKLGESNGLEIRGDFFNSTNHVNFTLPSSSIFSKAGPPSTTAGRITGILGNARQLQFSARFVF